MKWHVALTPTLPMEHYLIVVRQCKWWLRILTVVPSSVQALSFSHFRLFVTPWTAACQTSLSITNSQRLLKFMSISQWCHPTISPLATSFCLQSFTASGSFTNSQLFASAGQNIGASASASVLPIGIQGWFPLGLTGLISWQSKGLSRVFSSTTVQKHQFFSIQPSLWFQLTQPYTTTGKTIALTFVGTSMSLLFNMLSRFFIAFLGRSKCPNFMAAVTVHDDSWVQENRIS